MRYITVVLSPSDGTFHPVEGILEENAALHRGRVYHINLLNDSTVVALYGVEGDEEALREGLEDSPYVLRYDLFEAEGEHHIYVHVDQGEPVVSLLSIVENNKLIVDTPMEFSDDGLRATVMGEQDTLRDALDSVPEGVDVTVEQVGEYTPEGDGLLSILTERQREVLQVAVDEGYYDVPRGATHEEVADALGCAPSTASEHLRKIESKITEALVG